MNLPVLINKIYGTFTFTGLYSFEFVDKNRNTITEIFLMTPPETKSVTETTRSTTVPTLGSNYINDAGNGTKTINISGKLYFPYVGSPDNPVARNSEGLQNTIDGFTEFFKLRWMLMRYRDYTMTQNSRMVIPTTVMTISKEISRLYKKVSRLVKDKIGALYDEVQLIIHDYDMNDHFYCRINNFSSMQSSDKHVAIQYTIDVECHEPDFGQKAQSAEIKKTTNESVDVASNLMQEIGFDDSFASIQTQIGYNTDFVSVCIDIEDLLDDINTENSNIQAGDSTALNNLPAYVNSLLSNVSTALDSFTDTFLSAEQKEDYEAGDITIDELLDIDVLTFYNSLQRVELQAENLKGILDAIVQQDEIRYYTDADDYSLTEEQFDSGDEKKVENNINFYYYTVKDGDTSRIIAQRELKDGEKYINILNINDIEENDFIDGTIIGQEIKIPIIASTISRGDDNLIYSSDPDDIESFLYGEDIALGINDEMLISETGDLLGKKGINNAYENIENRIKNLKGSLNVFNPNWGAVSIDDGNSPFLVKVDRYLSDIVAQIQSDPRVESVTMNLDKLIIEGEKISVPMTVFFIGTGTTREVTT